MMALSENKLADIIDPFNSTSKYLDDILNISIIGLLYMIWVRPTVLTLKVKKLPFTSM